jgi:hypothetical protein
MGDCGEDGYGEVRGLIFVAERGRLEDPRCLSFSSKNGGFKMAFSGVGYRVDRAEFKG